MKPISVILVNYNGKQYNEKCIESIQKSTIWEQIQIVFVDNASTDGSMELAKSRWLNEQQIHFIQLDDNYGFAKANNIGIKYALEQGSKYFLLLNNDTEIESDTIAQMLECENNEGRIVVPKIYYFDSKDKIWCAGGKFTRLIKKAVMVGCNEKDNGQYDVRKTCDFANGCCLLLSADVVHKIGYLDERFFLYYEDTEYSFRAKKNNIEIWYQPKAKVYHKVNGSTGGNSNPACAYYITRNWLLCAKMYLQWRMIPFAIYFAFNRLAWIFIWLVQGKPLLVKAVWQGIVDFIHGKYGKHAVCNNKRGLL